MVVFSPGYFQYNFFYFHLRVLHNKRITFSYFLGIKNVRCFSWSLAAGIVASNLTCITEYFGGVLVFLFVYCQQPKASRSSLHGQLPPPFESPPALYT